MSDMVERVARALLEEAAPGISWDHMLRAKRAEYRCLAHAAIEEMRRPTQAMMAAGHNAMFQEPWDATTAPMIGAGFEAMIDEALK